MILNFLLHFFPIISLNLSFFFHKLSIFCFFFFFRVGGIVFSRVFFLIAQYLGYFLQNYPVTATLVRTSESENGWMVGLARD